MTKYVFQQSAFSADESVSVAPYASFTFTESATGDPADLWEDAAGLVPITGNVVLADEYGYVRAYLTAGFYDVAIVAGSLTKTLVDVFIGGAAVESVNGQTGIVVLGASDVGADAAGSAAAAQAAATAALGSASMDGTVDVMGREALTEVPGMVVDTTLRGQFKFLEVTADAQSFPLSLSGGVDCHILIQAYPSYTPGGSDTVNILGYTFKVDSHLIQMLLEHTQTAGGLITNTRVLHKSPSLPVLTQALADAVTSLAGLAHVTSPVLELDNSALTGPLASYDLSTASGPWRTLHGEVLVKLVGSTAHGITNFDGTGTALAVGEGVLIRGSSPSTQQYLKVVMM